jgi:hypothetical protein
MKPLLEDYLENPETSAPRVVRIDNKTIGYAEPIPMKPLCTACHGDAVEDDLASTVSNLYPDDQATGFQVGDVRGLFWVEFAGAHTSRVR